MDVDRRKIKFGENYSWLICAVCMLLIICTMGTCTNAFSVYLPYIAKSGLSESAVSLILSVRCGFSLVGMLLVPFFYRHLSLRLGMTLSCIVAAFSFILYAAADSAPMFYAAASLGGLGYGLGSLIPVSLVIHRWFKTNRGFAMGLCTAGTGISTIAFPPLITMLAEHFDPKTAFLGESIFLFIAALLVWLVLRDSPEEVGRKAYAKGKEAIKEKTENHYNLTGLQWPLILSAVLMLGGVSTAAPGHFPALFDSQGYDPYTISIAVSVFGILLALGKLAYGKMADHLGGCKPSVGFLLFLAVGCFFCCIGNGNTVLPMFLASALMGFGFPLASVGLSVLSGDLADEKHYMSTLKWFQVAYAGGGMLLSPLPGILFEHFGTYVISYGVFFVMTAFIIVVVAQIYHHREVVLHGKHHPVSMHPLMRIAKIFSFS
ncbi:MAG: MFS transporter [Firmicutes bacterium]|nr:MFS transporter [Bacillota bacterium]MBQ6810227.1 MFS transporter [Bacillota bacterium]